MAAVSNALSDRFQFQKPQINIARPTAWRMWLVSLCAFIVIIQSSLGDSFSSLFVALASVAAAVLVEFLFLHKGGSAASLKDGSAVASALVLALLLPNRIPPLYAAAGAVFAMAVVKHSFGGLGSNWLNPAAGGWLFIRFSWPLAFNRALENSPLSLLGESMSRLVSNPQGSPLGILKIDAAGLFAAASPLDTALRTVLNKTVFAFAGAELPGGYIDLFRSPFPGIIADRGILILLAGTIIITAFQVSRAWIPLVYLAVYGFLVRLAGALPYGGVLWNGDVLFSLCTGGTLAAAFLLVPEPAASAKSNWGIFISAASGGGAAFLFRYFGGEAYGAVLSVLFINAALPLIRYFESRSLYEKPWKAGSFWTKGKDTPPEKGVPRNPQFGLPRNEDWRRNS